MKLSDVSIRRPVLASMLSLALVLFGVIGYLKLPVREYPDVDPPVISITTVLPGASPQVVETAVTDILEEELSTLPGLRTLTSASAEQSSNITLEFTLDRDVDVAAQDVRDKVSRVRDRLPEDVREPVIAKQEADADPFFWMALSGENYSMLQLSDIADRNVKKRLQSLAGVGSAFIAGERRYSMRLWLSTAALAAYDVTVQDVEAAVRDRNVEVPAGRIESTKREFTVRSLGELKTPEEFQELVVRNTGSQLVKLKDLARVELGPEDERGALRFKGATALGVGIVRQSKANLISVADEIRSAMPAIQASLPPGVKLEVAFDGSVYVRRSIQEAQETLVIAAGLVILIIFVFLRNLRATIIPGLAIPTSIVSTFAIMYFLGFSVNNLTLLALTLAIGIVVDDAIIVLENAYRHQEELHEDPVTAATNGTREIAFAVIATTISLVAVFTPLAFLQGNTGRLFNEFGIAVAGSVLISGFVALTLTPMLCARVLRVPPRHGALYQALERGFDGLANGYARSLGWALRHRALVVALVLLSAGGSVFLFQGLKREFVPPEDRGWFLTFAIAPEGSTLEYTDAYMHRLEDVLARTEGIEAYFSITGGFLGAPSQGIVFSLLKDWGERTKSVDDIIGEVQPQYFGVPGVMAFASNPPAFGGFGKPMQFVVQHPDFDSLVHGVDTLLKRARQVPGLVNVDSDLRVNKPQLTVAFDRDRAEDLGVPVGDVAGALQVLLGGRRISTFTRENKQYDVIAQLTAGERATPSDMTGIYLRGRDGGLVQLNSVATVTEGVGPRQLSHFNRIRSATIDANLLPGFTLGEALDSMRALGREVLPAGSSVALSGESRELEESGSSLYFAFVLALVVVFMVLASQFESLIHPFTVLLAVPLAITGALLTLFVFRSTINLYSQIGMVLLIGLVTKNSILLVEYANQLKERGMATLDAVVEAARIRLRPILMTSVSTIMGALPIALGLGAGSISRRPLGYAIAGGILVSTLLTLYVVPVVYTIFDRAMTREHHDLGLDTPAAAEERS
ncbi:MAG: efflux RND transporter permease subunit [Gemmatimonadetes bacterium]|nr:efflux RND transporter permease subunit [Gemmatimonadota bacterium]MBK6782195.1 efflux RND transporter permease subunit [Gemmatimonadota bacterium]MBK7715303.1 efflux RND transporter permease subunit [Gemmatimonadota bacterium]MBK7923416.1 efflux RND transporter permease subunit [Gemmatimonadota bacterium]MBK9692370.1 efflux RND transporter permease subunit [Gemmatimonadota bacterium]